jgi:hypothetical protein
MMASSQHHVPAALPPQKTLGIHSVEGWLGPRDSLDALEKNIYIYFRFQNSSPELSNP